MRVMSGACVRRATLQAAEGAPMPTKQTSSLESARAAAMVIISSGVKSGMVRLRGDGYPLPNPPRKGEGVRSGMQHDRVPATGRHLPPCGEDGRGVAASN